MKLIQYLILGTLFGVTLTKSEVASWYRIQEMFRFDSFHMYGVIGSAVIIGVLYMQLIKRLKLTSFYGKPIEYNGAPFGIAQYLFGGTIFGLGWAMTGACPGPLYNLVGHGYFIILIVIASAILGTFCYGLLRNRLPH